MFGDKDVLHKVILICLLAIFVWHILFLISQVHFPSDITSSPKYLMYPLSQDCLYFYTTFRWILFVFLLFWISLFFSISLTKNSVGSIILTISTICLHIAMCSYHIFITANIMRTHFYLIPYFIGGYLPIIFSILWLHLDSNTCFSYFQMFAVNIYIL